MRHYLRDNKKQVMAIMGVILMIAFILPTGMKNFSDATSRHLIGHVGDKKVYNTDVKHAQLQWDFLENAILIAPQNSNGQQMQPFISFWRSQDPTINLLSEQMTTHPELFYLLQLEADRMGILVTPSQVDTYFKQAVLAVRLQTSSRAIVELENVTDPTYAAACRDAVAGFIKVQQSLRRAVMSVKVSRPVRHHEIERRFQQIELNTVELPAKDFLAQVPAPTSQQLQEQFDRYADSLAEAPRTTGNPHGFGYKHPNRVTLQYIGIRRDDVKAAVRATKSDYDWNVEAQKYYLRHQNQYPTTQSQTPATSLAAMQPSTLPTTQPFEQVRDHILEQLLAPEVQRRAREAQDRINTRLAEDWNKWAATASSTFPSTGPSTAPSQGYPAFEYLQKLAADVQQQTGVQPVISAINQVEDARELAKLPSIGNSFAGQFPFARYATEAATDVLPPAERNNPLALKRYQPSPWLREPDGSVWSFRITSGLPAAKPGAMSEVAADVERDYKIAQAYELAKKRAQELLSAAGSSGSLQSAAASAGLETRATGSIGNASDTIPGVDIEPAAISRFRMQAMDLLGAAATQPAVPPMKLIELSVQQEVFVVQLISAKPMLDFALLPFFDARVEGDLTVESAAPVLQQWYDFSNVAARMNWKDDTTRGG